jgi:hypothetical protein
MKSKLMQCVCRHTLEITQVDIRSGEARVCTFTVPAVTTRSEPSIVGNLVIVQLLLDGVRETLLLDWFARRYVLLTDFRAPVRFTFRECTVTHPLCYRFPAPG